MRGSRHQLLSLRLQLPVRVYADRDLGYSGYSVRRRYNDKTLPHFSMVIKLTLKLEIYLRNGGRLSPRLDMAVQGAPWLVCFAAP